MGVLLAVPADSLAGTAMSLPFRLSDSGVGHDRGSAGVNRPLVERQPPVPQSRSEAESQPNSSLPHACSTSWMFGTMA